MKRTRDQTARADYLAALSHPTQTEMGADPDGDVGPRVVAVLPGPATAYSIMTDDEGHTVLVRHSGTDDQHDVGRALTRPNTFVADARQRVAVEQERNRTYAASVSDFWKKQTGHG